MLHGLNNSASFSYCLKQWEMQSLHIINNSDNLSLRQVLELLPWEQMSFEDMKWLSQVHLSASSSTKRDFSTVDLELIALAVRDCFHQTGQVSHTYWWKERNHNLLEIRTEMLKKKKVWLLIHLRVGLTGLWYWTLSFFFLSRKTGSPPWLVIRQNPFSQATESDIKRC